jgi:hypothetical protein
MSAEIQPGQWVNVKVAKRPRAEAKRKTMVRLFEKDAGVTTERKRLARSRPVTSHRRGGRPWHDRPPRLPVAETTPGASYKIFASVDVVRDLQSLGDLVEVRPA